MTEKDLEAGWSNSDPAEDAPEDVYPDVETPEEPEPGFSNAKAVKSDEAPAEPEADSAAEDEPKKPAAKKTAAKKTAKKG